MEEEIQKKKKKRVMVAIDESEYSHYALNWTLEKLHDTIFNSQLFILAVQSNADLGSAYASSFGSAHFVSTTHELVTSIQERNKKAALALLERAKEICKMHGTEAETITEFGNPKEVICEAVEKYNIELLVLGSRGKGAIKRTFLGSVSSYCVHNAKCPVLVVKKPD
ncbi:Universal stress protein A-like protein [Morus notabilis]|uniref:Universal stress protein A-like protein n=1 Tax=Morus notabilis TaxID=981085 RepID=W9RYA7_9ROSA|nr:universal stress protein A-like protein [Morus notabilis]EXB77509.1 Universal stress protein A-like protein [Morus notabilis]